MDLAETKAESERLARALLEEQYFELSQESKKAASRHRQEMTDKDSIIRRVNYSAVINTCIYLLAGNRNLCFYFNLLSLVMIISDNYLSILTFGPSWNLQHLNAIM